MEPRFNDTLKRVIGILVNWHVSWGILTRIALAILVKIHFEMCQFTRIGYDRFIVFSHDRFSPSERAVFIFWSKITRNVLKRMKNQFYDFLRFLVFELLLIFNHLDTLWINDLFYLYWRLLGILTNPTYLSKLVIVKTYQLYVFIYIYMLCYLQWIKKMYRYCGYIQEKTWFVLGRCPR